MNWSDKIVGEMNEITATHAETGGTYLGPNAISILVTSEAWTRVKEATAHLTFRARREELGNTPSTCPLIVRNTKRPFTSS